MHRPAWRPTSHGYRREVDATLIVALSLWVGVVSGLATTTAAAWAVWRLAIRRMWSWFVAEVADAVRQLQTEMTPNGLDNRSLGTTVGRIERMLAELLEDQHPRGPPVA